MGNISLSQHPPVFLNDCQKEAVEHINGPLLILAGAGTGKTRVITQRIIYLIRNRYAHPDNILAITFTNKAADEMKNRVKSVIGDECPAWISTFHSACVKILRKNIHTIGLKNDFFIYDEYQSKLVIKECLNECLNEFDNPSLYSPDDIMESISNYKNNLIPCDGIVNDDTNTYKNVVLNVYKLYQKKLEYYNALDFDDLIMKTVLLFKKKPDCLSEYQDRFKYLLVDEYQDTNKAQYQFVKLLAEKNRNICVVGDDDQCIYQWRGATIRNIMEFERDYPDAKIVKLEENYRSPQIILDASHNIIKDIQNRKEKKLWSRKNTTKCVIRYSTGTDIDEADYIASNIIELHNKNRIPYKEIAVLYRMKYLSRKIENAMLNHGIPYKVYGGINFLQRKEIADVLAYLRFSMRHSDANSFNRIVNSPIRGVGKITVNKIIQMAKSSNIDLLTAVAMVIGGKGKSKAKKGLMEFYNIIEKFSIDVKNCSPSVMIGMIINNANIITAFHNDNEGKGRIENINKLIDYAKEYEQKTDDNTVTGFLDYLSISGGTGEDNTNTDTDFVSLMTIHSAKGMEFSIVFMPAIESGILPHEKSTLDDERRVCYVGMTRAKERLYMTYSTIRENRYGDSLTSMSPFFSPGV